MNQTEQELYQNVNLNRYKVDKNRILLVSIVNLTTTGCAIFSMLFYQWIHITFAFGQRSNEYPYTAGETHSTVTNLWINLLYATLQDQAYFLTFATVQDRICIDEDTFCMAIFYQLDFIGKLCFGIFALGFVISLYDVWLLIRYWCKQLVTKSKFFNQSNTAPNYKNNFRTIFIFVTHIVGLTLNYFAMALMKLEEYHYGISFWVFFGSLMIFALAVIYQKWKMHRIEKQEMIIGLLEREKEVLKGSKVTESSQSETFTI